MPCFAHVSPYPPSALLSPPPFLSWKVWLLSSGSLCRHSWPHNSFPTQHPAWSLWNAHLTISLLCLKFSMAFSFLYIRQKSFPKPIRPCWPDSPISYHSQCSLWNQLLFSALYIFGTNQINNNNKTSGLWTRYPFLWNTFHSLYDLPFSTFAWLTPHCVGFRNLWQVRGASLAPVAEWGPLGWLTAWRTWPH